MERVNEAHCSSSSLDAIIINDDARVKLCNFIVLRSNCVDRSGLWDMKISIIETVVKMMRVIMMMLHARDGA